MKSPIRKSSGARSRQSSVTIKDIAAELGLSFQAVSQALNPRPGSTSHVSQATRLRILAAAKKMGYRSHRAAQILRAGRSGLLGVLIFDHPHQIMLHRLHFVLAEIHAAGYRPFVHLADTRPNSGAMDGCLTMLDARVEGVVLVDPIGFPGEAPLQKLLDHKIPVVSLGSHQWRCITSYQVDREQGYRDLTSHLIESGCRSLVLLCAEADAAHRKFFQRFSDGMTTGFLRAAAAAPTKQGAIRTRIHTIRMEWEGAEEGAIHPIHRAGHAGAREILSAGLPDALLCQADSWAHGALRSCHEAGIRVPDDMMLTGFNDEPLASAGSPPLTTILQPYAELAREAIAHVTAQIREEQRNQPGKVIALPGRLVVRASSLKSGAPPQLLKRSLPARSHKTMP